MTDTRSSHTSAYLLLTLTALFWSGNFVLARAMHASIPPMALSFGRWLIALILLLPFGLPSLLAQRALWRPYWKRLIVLALLGVTAFNSLVYIGLQSTGATNAVLLNSFIPILIAALGALLFRMPLKPVQLLAVMISFCGVLTIVSHGDPARLLALDINRGDAIVFCAMVAWAVYTLLLRALPAELDRLGLLTLQIAIGLLGILPLFLLERAAGRTVPFTAASAATFAYMGSLPSLVAYYFYNLGVARVGAARAGSFIHLMPAFGAILSMLFLGEAVQGFHLAGIAAILAGVALSTRSGGR
ncbi:DMT family transporter [uncultured Aquitalea sp.]|uniref:DMT family transporter n=1 Tax=uncultured Aquitalea sp. TaxID=540272 RepID=UPI002600355D|nr:DMT family transporter [uncultured Aquitalea sp.]